MARQVRRPSLRRSRLVISTAPARSTASVPAPIARVSYLERNGSTVAAQPIDTYGSRIAVATCRMSSATANSDSVLCTSATANLGQRLVEVRGRRGAQDAVAV